MKFLTPEAIREDLRTAFRETALGANRRDPALLQAVDAAPGAADPEAPLLVLVKRRDPVAHEAVTRRQDAEARGIPPDEAVSRSPEPERPCRSSSMQTTAFRETHSGVATRSNRRPSRDVATPAVVATQSVPLAILEDDANVVSGQAVALPERLDPPSSHPREARRVGADPEGAGADSSQSADTSSLGRPSAFRIGLRAARPGAG